MNWNQMATNIAFVLSIVGATWWGSQNFVFAEPYNQYKQGQALRWMMYDERQLYSEYRDMSTIKHKTDADKSRLADIKHDMQLKRDEIKAMRGK